MGAPNGTSFGLYARWGAGKSSACEAIASKAYEAAQAQNKTIQIVILNAYELRFSSPSAFTTIVDQDVTLGATARPRRGRAFFELLARLGPAVSTALGAHFEVPSAGMLGSSAIKALADTGVAKSNARIEADAKRIAEDLELDKVIVIFDDLDRCSPEQAIGILSHCTDPIAAQVANIIIACDPEVLAAHAARAFGMQHTIGLEAISKYIHAPLHLPTGNTVAHREILERMMRDIRPGVRGALVDAAVDAVGIIPIREIRAALPQARLWLERAEELFGESDANSYARTLLYAALLAVILPGVIRTAQLLPDSFHVLFDLARVAPTAEKKDLEMKKILTIFGNDVVDTLRRRPDLSAIGTQFSPSWDDNQRMNAARRMAHLIGGFHASPRK